MEQFRFKGVTATGNSVSAEFEAVSKKEAKEKVEKIARQKGFSVNSIEQKSVFIYKAQKNGKTISGEQEAFAKEEVEKALVKLGYTVKSIKKKWFDFKGGVPQDEVVSFISLSAELLKQQLSFDEILVLLYEDTSNKRMKEVIKQIQKDLKDGKEGKEVYGKHEDIFGKFAAYMLSVASTSGNMALVFENTAKFMERDAEFKKNMRRSMLMPGITVLAVIAVVLFYVGYIFPVTAEMFLEFGITLPPMTAATLDISRWLQANWVLLLLSVLVPFAAFMYYIRTNRGRLWFDKNFMKMPLLGDLMHKTSIEIFARVFYTLYTGAGQNVEVIRTAAEACRNSYMEKQIKEVAITKMLRDGEGLVESLAASGVFTKTAISRFKLGAESGALKENARQLAQYYETQTTYKMESLIDTISLLVNLFIMIALIGITIVSSEAALISPEPPGGAG